MCSVWLLCGGWRPPQKLGAVVLTCNIITKSSKEKEVLTKFGVPPWPYILFRTFFTQNLVYFAHDWDFFWNNFITMNIPNYMIIAFIAFVIYSYYYYYLLIIWLLHQSKSSHVPSFMRRKKFLWCRERKKQQKLFRCENWFFSNTEAVLVDVRPKGSKLQKNGTTVHIREVLQKRWK